MRKPKNVIVTVPTVLEQKLFGTPITSRPETPNERRNRLRRERNQAMRDLGLVRVRGALGGVYWE